MSAGERSEEELPIEVRIQIDAACDRFEGAWLAGETPEIEPLLSGLEGPARARLLQELLILDLEYRRIRGERPTADDDRTRFPQHRALGPERAAPEIP